MPTGWSYVGRRAGQASDRESARKVWHPPHPMGRLDLFIARWSLHGVKMNGGTYPSEAAAIQKRRQMESDLEATGLESLPPHVDIAELGYAGHYRQFMALPQNVAALRQQNPVCCCCCCLE
jgi:hypothetical protein